MILISGGSGFIGSNLKKKLNSKKIKFKIVKTSDLKKKNEFFFKGVKCFIHLGFNFYKHKTTQQASYKYKNEKKIISKKI